MPAKLLTKCNLYGGLPTNFGARSHWRFGSLGDHLPTAFQPKMLPVQAFLPGSLTSISEQYDYYSM